MSYWLNKIADTSILSPSNLFLVIAVLVASFAASLFLVIFFLLNLPTNYFLPSYKHTFMDGQHRVVRALAFALKNIFGFLLVLLGLALSIPGVPGQGLMTILIGVMLLDFPGKRELERKIISRPVVLSNVNKLRKKFSRPPLQL
jgi:hypothetical protein